MNNRQFRISGAYLVFLALLIYLFSTYVRRMDMENLYTYQQFETAVENGEVVSAVISQSEATPTGTVRLTMKDGSGRVYYNSQAAVPGAVETAEDTAEALAMVMRGGTEGAARAIARLSCLLDPIAAKADVEGMGLKNTGGYIFYDGNNGNWLDPSKPAARQYLCTLAAELAQQGFDEILLTDVGYPTVGKLDKIDYNGADRAASIRLFLEELRSALGEYGVAVSIELPPEVITSGADDTAGLVLSDIAPLVDRVYAVTTVDQIPALEAAVSAAGEDTDFVAELTGHSPDVTGSCLILAD